MTNFARHGIYVGLSQIANELKKIFYDDAKNIIDGGENLTSQKKIGNEDKQVIQY